MNRTLVDLVLQNDAEDPDRYILISGFYGPGAVLGWELTGFAWWISWTLHPQKRLTNTIDIDFAVFASAAVIAAGHFLLQVYRLPIEVDPQDTLSFTRALHAVETSLSVIEITLGFAFFPCICVDLGRLWRPQLYRPESAFGRRFWTRLSLSFGLMIVTYIGHIRLFDWIFHSDSDGDGQCTLKLGVSLPSRACVPFAFLPGIWGLITAGAIPMQRLTLKRKWDVTRLKRLHYYRIINDGIGEGDAFQTSPDFLIYLIGTGFLSLLGVAVLMGPWLKIFDLGGYSKEPVYMIPFVRSAYSVSDLDQAVAAFAGATACGLSVLSTFRAWRHEAIHIRGYSTFLESFKSLKPNSEANLETLFDEARIRLSPMDIPPPRERNKYIIDQNLKEFIRHEKPVEIELAQTPYIDDPEEPPITETGFPREWPHRMNARRFR